MKKRCSKCRKKKPATKEHFYFNKQLGCWNSYCIPCYRDWAKEREAKKPGPKKGPRVSKYRRPGETKSQWYRRRALWCRYRLTLEEYELLLAKRKGCCHICGDSLTRPHVDHCHKTKRVRGVLCPRCNAGIGYFKDDPDLLAAVIAYLAVA